MKVNVFAVIMAALVLVTTQLPATAYAGPDDRQDCRQDEGRVGHDKRECKQEEVRDGVRGNQGERFGRDGD